jgi:hypothetical protein
MSQRIKFYTSLSGHKVKIQDDEDCKWMFSQLLNYPDIMKKLQVRDIVLELIICES